MTEATPPLENTRFSPFFDFTVLRPPGIGVEPFLSVVQVASCVVADRLIGLLADVVLDLAGVLLRRFGVDAERDEKIRERVVPIEHFGGDGHAAVGQGDETVLVHFDVAVFAQTLGRIGDAGLCDPQMLRHIDRADIAALLFHHQHGLQIVLGCFLDLHGRFYQLPVRIPL